MPLTDKGRKILRKMVSERGAKAGAREFYASENKGTIRGTSPEHPETSPPSLKRKPIPGGPRRMVLRKRVPHGS